MPTKFDEAAQAVFLAVVKRGFTRSEAAEQAGVSTSAVRALIKVGVDENGQPLAGTFAEALRDIEIADIEMAEGQLKKAVAKGEPWAVQMFLKGKAKDIWADRPGPLVQVNNLTIAGTHDERVQAALALAAELDSRQAAIDVVALPELDAHPEDAPVD